MKARILSPEEWAEKAPSVAPMFPYADPGAVDVVVVEQDGRVIAALTVMKVTHFEGLWIDPAHKGPGTLRALLRAAWAIPRARGERWSVGGAAHGSDKMARFVRRLGGVPLALDFFMLPVGGQE